MRPAHTIAHARHLVLATPKFRQRSLLFAENVRANRISLSTECNRTGKYECVSAMPIANLGEATLDEVGRLTHEAATKLILKLELLVGRRRTRLGFFRHYQGPTSILHSI